MIVYAKRTPIGKLGGVLSSVRVDDMMAYLIRDFLAKGLFDPQDVDDVIVGCANQAGEDNRNLARMSSLLAGLPYSVPGMTINRLCGSSLDGVIDAVGRISMGLADCVLVGGAESMTRAPLVISKSSRPFGRDAQMFDTTFGWRFPNDKMKTIFPLYSMGETAEEVAVQYNISRKRQDEFALASHQKAVKAQREKAFVDEILPIEVFKKKQRITVERDEGPREDTSLEKLSALKPVFKKEGTVTAGNSSTMNDGAALVVVVSEDFLKRHSLRGLAEITGAGLGGVHPNLMGLGPVSAVKKLLKRYRKNPDDFDAIELNEAFAAQALACLNDLKFDEKKVNCRGGAISLGHPLGQSGARILTTLIYILQHKNLREGLATMCVGVGQGVALSIRRCL